MKDYRSFNLFTGTFTGSRILTSVENFLHYTNLTTDIKRKKKAPNKCYRPVVPTTLMRFVLKFNFYGDQNNELERFEIKK